METLDKNKSGNPMEGEARGNMSIEEFLKKDEQKDLLRFLTAGSVDDGKSTLIGRLLFDSKKLYEDQLDALERDSKRVGQARGSGCKQDGPCRFLKGSVRQDCQRL